MKINMGVKMETNIKDQCRYLSLGYLNDNWESEVKSTEKKDWTPVNFLKHIIKKEYEHKKERSRISRSKSSKAPIEYTIETYPFLKQPQLNKARLLSNYESLNYIHDNRNLILIGPTGAGKTGLATSFLLNAVNAGHRGLFVLFSDLINELWSSQADNKTQAVLNKYASYKCLLIDELGYLDIDTARVGLFFSLMQKRYKKTCTIVTTNLGFKEWEGYFGHKQLASALVDRLIDNGHVINLKKCVSLRSDADID